MSARRPVSLKLAPHIEARITELAKAQNRSTGELIQEAIAQYAEREERRAALRQNALRAWESYQRTGIHATHAEADGRMAKSETGREPASAFYQRLSATSGTDIDLEAAIRENQSDPGEH